jgi:hypothetical protein
MQSFGSYALLPAAGLFQQLDYAGMSVRGGKRQRRMPFIILDSYAGAIA